MRAKWGLRLGCAVALSALVIAVCLPAWAGASPEPYLWVFATARAYLPGEQPEIGVRGYRLSTARLDIYEFNARAYLSAGGSERIFSVDAQAVPGKRLVRSVRVPVSARSGRVETGIKLDPLPKGSYLVVASSPQVRQTQTAWFTVTSLGLVSKQSAGALLVWAVDLAGGAPVPGVSVKIERAGSEVASQVTGDDGLVRVNLPHRVDSSMVTGVRGDDFAVLYSSYWWDARDHRVYIYTDRPVYRPGQKVYWKAVCRLETASGYEVIPGQDVGIEIRDPYNNIVAATEAKSNSWGSVSGEFTLGPEPALGMYSIIATVGVETHYGSFDVSEYRKPEWSVDVSFDRPMYVSGDTLNATVQADYYFGAPVSGAKVEWRVYRQETGFSGRFSQASEWGEEYREWERLYGGYYGELVTYGTVNTDSSGAGLISFDAPPSQGKNYKYILEAEVTDLTGRSASGRGIVPVARGLFDIYVSSDRHIAFVGEPFTVVILASDLNGSPVDERLTLTVMRRRYTKTGTVDTPVQTHDISTGQSGEARIEVTAEAGGNLVLVARGRDSRGNDIVSEAYVWVPARAGAWAREFSQDVQVVLDRDVYQLGESARVLISAPPEASCALLTVEDSQIREARVVRLAEGSALTEIPVSSAHAPNTYVVATVVLGREIIMESKVMNVSDPGRALTVTIEPDKREYGPGDTASYTIRTHDSEGSPVEAEVSFGLVDESIYAVRPDATPAIGDFFHGRRYNSVTTEHSFPVTYYGGADKEGGSQPVRKYFPDTAAWFPSITTDANGTATVKVTLPDSLTTWRATVRAHTLSTAVGQAEEKIAVSKPLVGRLVLPRFYTLGDRGQAAAVVHNYTSETRSVGISLSAEGASLKGPSKQYVTIPPGGQARVEWEVEPTEVGRATFVMHARSLLLTDSVQIDVPVQPFGEERVWSSAGEIPADVGPHERVAEFNAPDDIVPGTRRLSVTVSPGYAGVVTSALDYLVQYPYGCVEQTVSAFLPDVAASEAFESLGLPGAETPDALREMVDAGLARLYKFQHGDGGFGWWEYDESSPWMTAYVLYGLDRAARAGFLVSKQSVQRASEYLAGILRTVKVASKPDLHAFAFGAYVLAETGRATPAILSRLKILANNTSDSRTLAFAALAARAAGDKERTTSLIKRLAAGARRSESGTYWRFEDPYSPWRSETVETTAWAFLALLECDPTNPDIPEAARYLA
ncbi:MAG: MG2 domain-containing protein, partial [Firmicutes bacterium]|nr:MG2 domain-containing protein [Bacillota bacterium]